MEDKELNPFVNQEETPEEKTTEETPEEKTTEETSEE